MFHPHTELKFISVAIGYGVVATRPIPAGTITWAHDSLDQVYAPRAAGSLAAPLRQVMEKYSFTDRRGNYVLCWDHARFVNHNCDANCLSPGGFDIEVAIRDIKVGEELTDDYGTLNIEHPFNCLCESPICRNVINPEDAERLADWWDKRVSKVVHQIAKVQQPLWELVRDAEQVKAMSLGRAPMASCIVNARSAMKVARAG